MTDSAIFAVADDKCFSVLAIADSAWWLTVTIEVNGVLVAETRSEQTTHKKKKILIRQELAVCKTQTVTVKASHSKDEGQTWWPSKLKLGRITQSEIVVFSEDSADRHTGDDSDLVVSFSAS